MFCIISHIASQAFDDDAFVPGLVSPDQLFRLRAKRQGCQVIPWKKEMLDRPIFRRAISDQFGVHTSKDLPLADGVYQSWIKRLGEALGYLQTLTTYCLRRALGNAINGTIFLLPFPSTSAPKREMLTLPHRGNHR